MALIRAPVVEEDAPGEDAEGEDDGDANDGDDGEEDDDSEDEEDFDPDAEGGSGDEGSDGAAAMFRSVDGAKKVDVDGRDREGHTPLHVALLSGSINCVKALIEAECRTYITLEGSPPLHMACAMSGFECHEAFAVEAVKALLPSMENECVMDDYGRTAVSIAAQHGVLALVKALVDDFTPPNEDDTVDVYVNLRDKTKNRPIHWAAAYGHADVVEYLLSKGADPALKNDHKDNALHCAVRGRDVKCVELLLKANGDMAKEVNAQGQTPAQMASARGFGAIAKMFKTSVSTAADEAKKRVIIAPDTCFLHHSCPPITRGGEDPPPENVNRLNVLLNATNGTLRAKEFKDV